jgi:hypothetical protein
MHKISLAVICAALVAANTLSAGPSAADEPSAKSIWSNGEGHRKEAPNPKAAVLPLISVSGNHFVDPSGATVLFRGVSIVDPDNLVDRGHWNRELFAAIKASGANLVRIPIHPAAWRHQTPRAYLQLLDQAVDWCTDLGMHVIIDWHSIGNLKSGMFQEPIYNTTTAETFDFWRIMASHFKGNHTVAFFELFNEPTHQSGLLGSMSWTEWRDLNEQMISIIRYSNRETIPLVAGFDWAYDLDNVHYEPIRAEGVGYVTHPYPFKRSQPWEPKWEENFAFVAEHYPMIATEIGFDTRPGEVIDDNHYGNRITRFLEQRGISWVAWVFDSKWGPPMLSSYDGFTLNACGEFFKMAMQRPPAQTPQKPAR